MNRARVAAIIPVYNRPEAVIEALDSVAAQTVPPDRLIVVDDGSTDDTADRVQSWIDHCDITAQLLRQSNAGVSVARNIGAALAEDCDLLAFLDSDDLWPDDYLQRMAKAFADHPDAVAGSCDKLRIDCRTKAQHFESVRYLAEDTTVGLLVIGPASTPNTVYRAAAFRAVGGYEPDQRCGEDYQLQLRLSLRGPWLYVAGEPVSCRRFANTSSNGESAQLSKQHADRRLRRAEMLDRFVNEEGGKRVVPEPQWCRRLGRLWYAAGRQVSRTDHRAEAAACYRRALDYLPRHLRARWMRWTTKG